MVVDDVAEAARLVAEGESVVLVVAGDSDQGVVGSGGPGRLAVFVGSLADPETRRLAAVMDDELFGSRRSKS